MTNRVNPNFLFEYMDLRDQGLSAEELGNAAAAALREEQETLEATLSGRLEVVDENETLLDEASQIDITRAALEAIKGHKAVCQKLEERGKELSTLLRAAEKEQELIHKRKQMLNERLQKLRSELYNGSPNPRWIDLNQLYARSKEIGYAAATGKRL